MPPPGEDPAFPDWTCELQVGSIGDLIDAMTLAGNLRASEGWLDEVWRYLRRADTTSERNLWDIESKLEDIYQSISPAIITGLAPSSGTAAEAVQKILILIDATKAASQVWRSVIAAAKQQDRKAMPLPRVGADEEESANRKYTVITSIMSLRAQMTVTAQLLEQQSKRSGGVDHKGNSSTSEPGQRYYHGQLRIAG